MNYIKRLEEENREKNEAVVKGLGAINEIRRYLNSEKFRCGDDLDGYVNVADMFQGLRVVEDKLTEGIIFHEVENPFKELVDKVA